MIKKLFLIIILILVVISPMTNSAFVDLKSQIKIRNNIDFFDDIEQDDLFIDIDESFLYSKFKSLFGNDSKIQFCGPAYVKSTGMGLHMSSGFRLIQLNIPFRRVPSLFNLWPFLFFPRNYWLMEFFLCNYLDSNETKTKIWSLKDGKNIYINGSHTILVGIFFFNAPNNARKLLIKPLFSRILNISEEEIKFPVEDLQGDHILEWESFTYWLLHLVQFNTHPRLIIPWYGLNKNLDFFGYTPFVFWTNSSIMDRFKFIS
jgi:hypothetical protein